MSSKHYAGYSDALSANALIRMTIDDSELRQGLKATEDVFKKLQMTLFSIGRNMETIGQQLVAPFASAAKVFADFDDQMRRVAAVTGAMDGLLSKLTSTARRLGASTAFTASQVAQGIPLPANLWTIWTKRHSRNVKKTFEKTSNGRNGP